MKPLNVREIKRFDSKVEKIPFHPCWEWTASKNWSGYGVMNIRGTIILAHRISWFIETGKNPGKLFVCHTCDNPSCVRPEHLFLGTCKDNVADMWRKGRAKVPAPHEPPNKKYFTAEERKASLKVLYRKAYLKWKSQRIKQGQPLTWRKKNAN